MLFLAALGLVSPFAGSIKPAGAETLRSQIEALAAERGFVINGLDSIGDEPGRRRGSADIL